MKDLARVKEKLKRAAYEAIADGWRLAPTYYTLNKNCCLIGSLTRDAKTPADHMHLAVSRLGLDFTEVTAIMLGFDRTDKGQLPKKYDALYKLGQEMRMELCP